MKSGIDDTQILRKDCSVNLSNGDKFGLLPDTFWYEVIYYSDSDTMRIPADVSENNTEEYKTDDNAEETMTSDTTSPQADQNETVHDVDRLEPSTIGNYLKTFQFNM